MNNRDCMASSEAASAGVADAGDCPAGCGLDRSVCQVSLNNQPCQPNSPAIRTRGARTWRPHVGRQVNGTSRLPQVPGCRAPLSGLKYYYLKSKLCQQHHKAPMILIGGVESRFCQQCCKVHPLAEFDGGRRCAPGSALL